jgi:hypothetical protein
MLASFQRLPVVLRASLLGLLLLAVVGKPMASSLCEIHQLGHTLAARSHVNFHSDSAAERQMDSEHASGAHGLLHGGDQGSTYADIAAVVTLPVVHFESVQISLPAESRMPPQQITRLFRPPIA